jgi:threonine aldolase
VDFRSDNTHGASPEILAALASASGGNVTSYGDDPLTERLRVRCNELFEREVDVVPVATGTAGNALAVASLTPPWGAVFCHEDAHIHRDEMGAPEFFSGGAKLVPIAGARGKLTVESLSRAIDQIGREGRTARPSCVSITQTTEAGTVYSVDELRALCDVAKTNGCRVHMDGARFANAVASTGASPGELTWRLGVDVLVFGATKNGALAAELLVVFDRSLTAELVTRWQRGGHRLSKMRFLSAQFDAYLANDLWLRNARHANAMAARLAKNLNAEILQPEILQPVQANIVFARFTPEQVRALSGRGFLFYDWPLFGEGAVRLVTGFNTTEEDVDAFTRTLTA